jgi:hypothetical protein
MNTEGKKEGEEITGKVDVNLPHEPEVNMEEDVIIGEVKPEAPMSEEEKKFKEENDAAIAQLEEKYGLDKEQLQACMFAEQEIGKPETGITTLIGAMDHYKEQGFTEGQMLFMAVNANSRANMFRNDAEKFHTELQESKGQLNALMQLTQMKIEQESKLVAEAKSVLKIVPDAPEGEEGKTLDTAAQGTKEIVED